MQYRELNGCEICRELFVHFDRYQQVTKCWHKVEGEWAIVNDAFVEQWSEENFDTLTACLRRTIETSGVVIGAFSGDLLKGFVSVEGCLFGSNRTYMDLSSIHVSCDARGHGTGKTLFSMAAVWAKAHGAQKLYISAHPSVESQSFYQAMGCVDAAECDPVHVAAEPFDRQLEFNLSHI